MEAPALEKSSNSCANCQAGPKGCQSQRKAGSAPDMESELWKPVVGFEGLYEVSNAGRVRSVDRVSEIEGRWGRMSRPVQGVVLKPLRHTGGYQRVMLWKDGRAKQTYIHKIVLEAFVGARPNGMQVAHGNGDKQDNRLANLRWATPAENQADREAHGTGRKAKPHPATRLGLDMARIIRRVHAESSMNLTKLAACFGIPRTTAADIVNNRVWREPNG